MGMNTCFRVADQLANMVAELSPGFSERQVLPILQQFDRQFARDLAPILSDNHAAGCRWTPLLVMGLPTSLGNYAPLHLALTCWKQWVSKRQGSQHNGRWQ
jgi:hypothetical protein